jgi:hypothetical protein
MNTLRIVYAFLVVVILIAVSDSVAQLEPCRMATGATPRPWIWLRIAVLTLTA